MHGLRFPKALVFTYSVNYFLLQIVKDCKAVLYTPKEYTFVEQADTQNLWLTDSGGHPELQI